MKQSPGSELSAQSLRGAQTDELLDHDLSRSLILNQLSHPGTPTGTDSQEAKENIFKNSIAFEIFRFKISDASQDGFQMLIYI